MVVVATHATFSPGDPYGSGIWVAAADGEGLDLVTVDELYAHGNLASSPVVVVSACESGMTWVDDSADVIALPPAFGTVGAAAVLASLWPVEDVSTSLLVERFVHHLLDPGELPATALGAASKDLRNVTKEQALDRCNAILLDMESRNAAFGPAADAYLRLRGLRSRIEAGSERPFEAPVFWAGFIVAGCGWRSISRGGAIVRAPDTAVATIEALARVSAAYQSFTSGGLDAAASLLEEAVVDLDGQWLGRALLLLGETRMRQGEVDEGRRRLETARDVLEAHSHEDARYAEALLEEIGRISAEN
jgi:hypothetical protein